VRHQRHTPPSLPRLGFTLIELLVVIGIILLMITLLAVTFGGMFGTARAKATRGTIEKVNSLINDRMENINLSMENGELRKLVLADKFSPGGEELAKIKVRKQAYKKAFPQSWAEITPTPTYAASNTVNAAADSSEVLYYVLTRAPLFGAPSVGTDSFVSNELGDTDGDGLLEFVDGWERPLRFYRWPTRLVRPEGTGSAVDRRFIDLLVDGTTTGMLGTDPDDPKGIVGGTPNFERDFHTPNTYSTPLLVSGGEDGDTGLREPTDFTTTDDHMADTGFGYLAHPKEAVFSAADPGDSALNDNITNRKGLGNE
jgi:prepilin-type N-terminal cleavage/methylation domain-containing protein